MSKNGPPKRVKSASRTLALLRAFAEARRPLALAEVAERLAAPKSSCHELVQTLVQEGFMLVLDGGRRYYPSRRLLDLAQQINQYNPIKLRIEEALRRLRDRTGETSLVARLQGQWAVALEICEGTQPLRYSARPGDLLPLHADALGKALLAGLPEEDRRRLVAELPLERFTERTLADPVALLAALARGGIQRALGEHHEEVGGLAAPVEIHGHRLAIGIAGPRRRIEAKLADHVQVLEEVAAELA